MTEDAVLSSLPKARSQSAWVRFLRRPSGVLAAIWLLAVIVGSVGAPLFTQSDPLDQDLSASLDLPGGAHLLGADLLGRDVLSRVLYGGRPALLGVIEAIVPWLLIGVSLGLIAGYRGGRWDSAISRLADLMFSIPGLVILLVVGAIFPGSLLAIMLAFGVIASCGLIRIVRSVVLGIRNELYISAARVAGVSNFRIVVRHVLPRMMSTVIVQASLFAAVTLVVQSGLAFLNFGVEPPQPSWGGLVADAAQAISQDPWLLVPGGGVIALTVVALVLLGNAIRDVKTESWSGPAAGQQRSRARTRPLELGHSDLARPDGDDVLLSVQNLSVEFHSPAGPVPILSDVSLTVRRSETVAILGESGCGKTMMISAVLGLLPARMERVAGHFFLNGKDLTRMSARDLGRVRGSGIGFVAQDALISLDPCFTVGRLIAEGVRRHTGLSRGAARRRAVELLRMVNLPNPEDVAKRYPHQVSGGMAQRAAIALALAGDPELLIADEPTTALDVTVQREILSLLHRLQQERGMAVLIVTHDWGVVATLAHRAIVMYAGQVVEEGKVDDIYRLPLHPYTIGLLAANPHRAVPGQPLPAIVGSVPSIGEWPDGCRFSPRCPLATDECSAPIALLQLAPERDVRCIHVDAAQPELALLGPRHA
jgi:peptide/nickel transport system permease protein